jgi:IS5 family transposase
MRPKERRDGGQNDFFRARLDQIVDMDNAVAKLGRAIDWRFLEERFGAVHSEKAGHAPLPTRLMAGLSILKHIHDLSDGGLCALWVENLTISCSAATSSSGTTWPSTVRR